MCGGFKSDALTIYSNCILSLKWSYFSKKISLKENFYIEVVGVNWEKDVANHGSKSESNGRIKAKKKW